MVRIPPWRARPYGDNGISDDIARHLSDRVTALPLVFHTGAPVIREWCTKCGTMHFHLNGFTRACKSMMVCCVCGDVWLDA